MANNVEKMYLNTPLTLLLILLIILIIFCVMQHKLYNLQSIMFDVDEDNHNLHNIHKDNLKYISPEDTNIKINKHIVVLYNIIEKSKLEIKEKEKFSDLTRNDLITELANLNALQTNLVAFDASAVNNSTNLENIQNMMNNISTQRLINKDKILKVLTNIYTIRYIESINQGNAISYNEYNKYTSPKKNIYYKQYT